MVYGLWATDGPYPATSISLAWELTEKLTQFHINFRLCCEHASNIINKHPFHTILTYFIKTVLCLSLLYFQALAPTLSATRPPGDRRTQSTCDLLLYPSWTPDFLLCED